MVTKDPVRLHPDLPCVLLLNIFYLNHTLRKYFIIGIYDIFYITHNLFVLRKNSKIINHIYIIYRIILINGIKSLGRSVRYLNKYQ